MRWLGLAGISLLAFTAFLDYTVVNTALPAIQAAIHVHILQLQWVINIYSLALAMFMVASGKFADRYGHKKIFYTGAVIFFIAAIGCGLSGGLNTLIFFRALQGLGGAILFTVAVSLLYPLFPESERPKAISIYGAITGMGLAVGPFLGGVILTSLSWRWIFFINVPIIVLGTVLCFLGTRRIDDKPLNIKMDWAGLFFLIISIGALMYGIIRAGQIAWNDPLAITCILAAIIGSIILVIIEKRVESPLLDFNDFSNKAVVFALLICAGGSLISGITLFFNPLFLNIIKHWTIFFIGLTLVAAPIMQVMVSLFFVQIEKKMGILNLCTAGLVCALAAAICQFFFSSTTPILLILCSFALVGVTWGVANVGPMVILQSHVTEEKIGTLIGTAFTGMNIVGTLMLALSAVAFTIVERIKIKSELILHHIHLTTSQQHLIQQMISDAEHAKNTLSQFSPEKAGALWQSFRQAFLSGYHAAMMTSIVASLFFILAAWLLRRRITL